MLVIWEYRTLSNVCHVIFSRYRQPVLITCALHTKQAEMIHMSQNDGAVASFTAVAVQFPVNKIFFLLSQLLEWKTEMSGHFDFCRCETQKTGHFLSIQNSWQVWIYFLKYRNTLRIAIVIAQFKEFNLYKIASVLHDFWHFYKISWLFLAWKVKIELCDFYKFIYTITNNKWPI